MPGTHNNKSQVVWACWGEEGTAEAVTLFAASLRRYGGSMAGCPVSVYVPQEKLSAWLPAREKWDKLGVEVRPFSAPPGALAFPYAAKPLAAAQAEAEAAACETLVWFDAWSLAAGNLEPLRLKEGEDLAYRPVEVLNIGCPAGEAPDAFWSQIYQVFDLAPDAAFPMVTTCDRRPVRAYINAAMLAVRPGLGLLAAWREAFLRLLQQEAWQTLFDAVPDRAYFFHQAVLTGLILARLSPARMRELPHTASYPLHLQERMPEGVRVNRLSDLLLCRYYDFFEAPEWPAALALNDDQRAFLAEHGIRDQ
ncbi:MAG TPA: hypothetical protein VD973_15745 [Symbiobacteriaceae bacterium]|nr:hypothetical protein [Symbiobacteriaceae bacterium]